MRGTPLLAGLLLALLSTPGLAAGKKVKSAPVAAPVAPSPVPAPPPEPPPSAVEPKPAPVAVTAPEPAAAEVKEPVVTAPAPPAVKSGLLLQASGGVVMPFSVLGIGGRAEVRASLLLDQAPLGFSLSFGVEQHTAQLAAFVPPPGGGFDKAALDNQTIYPAQLLAQVLLVRDEHNRLQLGAGYALLITWSQTQALGKLRDESGVGHELGGELAYARRFGSIELEVRARYSVRRTAVGPYTSAMELPWYQTAGLLLGLGLWP